MQEQLHFLKIALLDHRIGAMTRSSQYVVRAVIRNFGTQNLKQVVEYGPGDGVLTKEILKRMPKDGKLFAIETNPHFIKILQDIGDPRLKIIEGTAQEISNKLRQANFGVINLAISSIPFSLLKSSDREKIVKNTFDMLEKSGRFIIFQYSPIALGLLKKHFDPIAINTQLEPRNIPPMFIMTASK